MLTPLINRIWLGTLRAGHRRFEAALADPQHHQSVLLQRYIAHNELTEFGRRHRFSDIDSPRHFQQYVPLTRYEDYEAEIERIRAGESDVLTSGRVRLLEPTSGTTKARKLIPYTAELQAEFRAAIAPWLVDLARMHPGLAGGRAYWSISPAVVETEPDGSVPIGFDTDRDYLGGWLGWLTGQVLVDCDDLRALSDIESFRRQTLLRMLAARDLRLISVWHPTFLSLLLEEMIATWPEILGDLENSASGSRDRGAWRKRASELRDVDPADTRSVWPDLCVISCWGDGQASGAARALEGQFPHASIQHKGLLATEGCVSIPWRGSRPLAIRSHFFEFIDSDGNVRFAWELERDATYSVVLTTGGGLYRYRLDDQVVVDGFVQRTPSIRFIGRSGCVSDLRGEKLSEPFVADILSRVLPTYAPASTFALLAADESQATPRYRLYVNGGRADSEPWDAMLEAELAKNPHYANCVHLGQLARAEIVKVGDNAPALYLEHLRRQGRPLGGIKPVALSTLSGWNDVFGSAAT